MTSRSCSLAPAPTARSAADDPTNDFVAFRAMERKEDINGPERTRVLGRFHRDAVDRDGASFIPHVNRVLQFAPIRYTLKSERPTATVVMAAIGHIRSRQPATAAAATSAKNTVGGCTYRSKH